MEADTLIYKAKKSRLVGQALVSGAALGLSVWMMGNAEIVMHRELRLIVFFVAFIGCIVFGYTTFYNFLRIFNSEPLLKADAAGLWFHGSPMYNGKILWSDIAGYQVAQYGLSKKVLVQLKDPVAFTTKYADFRKYVFQRMYKRYGTPIALPYNLFQDDVLQMIAAIRDAGF
jgi:hypothetical protein